eukprot:428300_1
MGGCLSAEHDIEPVDDESKTHITTELNWKKEFCSNPSDLIFINDRRVHSTKANNQFNTCVADKIISSELGDVFTWQITARTFGGHLFIGWICDYHRIENNIHIGQKNKNEFGIYIYQNSSCFRLFTTDHSHMREIGKGFEFRSGDRFKIKIDFESGKIYLYYNGKFVGRIFKEVTTVNSMKIIPAVSIYNFDDVLIKTIIANEKEEEEINQEEETMIEQKYANMLENKKIYIEKNSITTVVTSANTFTPNQPNNDTGNDWNYTTGTPNYVSYDPYMTTSYDNYS